MKQEHTAAAVHTRLNVRKLVLTAMFACLGFVLSTFVYFPSMAPFQHFINVLAAVFVGPWYGFAAALLTGLMRMATGRTIQAVVGAVFGAFLSGLLYRKTNKRLWGAVVGEVIGTGFISAMAAYPLMRLFYGLPQHSPFYYIPFYAPSSILGALLAVGVLYVLKRSGVLDRMQSGLDR
ncbi:energy coupling factor transporter S component ThiW [Lawsonibacter celer]|jgi:energy coupling factor transporter S component ThiW|uniref:energy coupling factor transporter S component ThiW n=1 Tax=Lawsonibacter celer TaxID=2986526 RepID=UPI0016458B3D|nr:energy coupling factor transporter S component ThiW [Lawsonibacter celer]